MRGGAIICLKIRNSAFLREKLHGAQVVSDSLVRSPLASGMRICLKNEGAVNPSAHQLVAKPQKERQL